MSATYQVQADGLLRETFSDLRQSLLTANRTAYRNPHQYVTVVRVLTAETGRRSAANRRVIYWRKPRVKLA